MSLPDLLIQPFAQYPFMQRAMTACILLAVSGVPLGFFMNHRRMALVSDAMSHAILPGVAIAFLTFGLNMWSMTLGGLAAGVLVSLLAVFLIRNSGVKEDSAFTLLFLLSLTSGILLLSLKGSGIDLLHMLFGDILAIENQTLVFMGMITIVTLLTLVCIYRGLVLDCFDPDFLAASGRGRWVRPIFHVLFVINLVSAFQALGTLLALGLMLLPAIAVGFWSGRVGPSILLGILLAIAASYAGLLLSFATDTPSGPMVVFLCALLCLLSILVGRRHSVLRA